MDITGYGLKQMIFWHWKQPQRRVENKRNEFRRIQWDIFAPLRHYLDNIAIKTPQLAHRLCKLIPAQCPFEREIKILGHTLLKIPPLCKLNPLYEEVVALRWRAMCYLAEECGEDVSEYC